MDTQLDRVIGVLRQSEFRIAADRHVPSLWIKKLTSKAKALCRRTARSPVPLLFVVDFEEQSAGSDVLCDPTPLLAIQSTLSSDQKLVAIIDREGRLLRTTIQTWDEAANWEMPWAAQVSEDCQAFVLAVYGRSLSLFDSGRLRDQIDDVNRPRYPHVSVSDRHVPAREFPAAVRRHFDDKVQYERGLAFWGDRARREFVGGPERVFQKDLWFYLQEYLLDQRRVDMEYSPAGLSDRTDIYIETVNDEQYLLEIKWLGKTVTGGSYDEEQAKRGARQTIEYLERIPSITRAALVLYDGRKDDMEIAWDSSHQHPKLDLSLRLYIVSKTASEIGRRSS
ncbi:MAG TPA: hypothetical protein VD973_26470 [Symbiobacteriaceae bacterium]|nr:hypothetical protein [Symbiobacteriaceae bacterium]